MRNKEWKKHLLKPELTPFFLSNKNHILKLNRNERQKILEATDELREKVFGYAIKTAKAISYVNAGTIEFLYNPHRQEFFLLEINSRIQVEHPITEMTTGIDIVKGQIKIATG